MPLIPGSSRILVKSRAGVPDVRLSVGGDTIRFKSEPLFKSIGRTNALGAAPDAEWHVLTPAFSLDGHNPWDVCHALVREGPAIAGTDVLFAEPDFAQVWNTGREADQAFAMSLTCDAASPQNPQFPINADPLWFRRAAFADFDAALAAPVGGTVRVAHLDTGYDPDHATVPEHLDAALQKNFVDADRPNDARDTSDGLLNFLGHGTGTLSILAGKPAGGLAAVGTAPFANVVPVRVANSVLIFFNSAIAQAFDYVHTLCADPATRVDVVTMSMGGTASQAWAEAVNALYDAGVFVVTAAGNNYGNLPTHEIVFPARFNRVVAACGVMADGQPYAGLGLNRMAGNYGPPSKERTAIAAYTPNVPWARLGCSQLVDLDGAGTSSATPQVAAAAAIWIRKNRAALDAYPEPWMRVEAVRKALFDSASADIAPLGCGGLRARAALDVAPAAAAALHKEAPDSAFLSWLNVLLGLGLDGDAELRMLQLEAMQLSQSPEIEPLLAALLDRENPGATAELRNVARALANHPRASNALREALGGQGAPAGRAATVVGTPDNIEKLHVESALNPEIPRPAERRLRIFAYDPSLGSSLDTLSINEARLSIPWEDLQPGPVGEYLEVVDIDPASQCAYAPVDLNHPSLLAQDGLAPSEGNPQLHQQMAYAVAMRTIRQFERSLGRVALWAPHHVQLPGGRERDEYVRRLRIYPHALRARNAYYSPDRNALLLGYFNVPATTASDLLPGGLIFTALSHDIIAHETTHALLDGLHRRFREPSNRDVLAFHEAFADIVALFQHFSMPESLRDQIARTRGDLSRQSMLSQLAVQFGAATGKYAGLRNAIGEIVDGVWTPYTPSRGDYQEDREVHEHGAVLVAAVFDAFLQIYRVRADGIVRLATQGTGILPDGALPALLADRLTQEAAKVAGHVLDMCIRALDYCPPVDITFGEYLRALITADRDLVPNDDLSYRVAFISAFQKRGILPASVRSLAVESLNWERPPVELNSLPGLLEKLSFDWDLRSDRRGAYFRSLSNAKAVHAWLMDKKKVSDEEIAAFGFSRSAGKVQVGGIDGELRPIEVHSVRPARRVGPDGQQQSDLVVELTQTFRPATGPVRRFRGGCTLLIDRQLNRARYLVRKRVDSAARLGAQQAFALEVEDAARETYFGQTLRDVEPFAALHRDW